MGNIAINKTADASSYIHPFRPERGVDGILSAISRWVGSGNPPISGEIEPMWYRIDLGNNYWINRWVVKQMGSVGWSYDYNLSDYKLQGSLDHSNWFEIDSVKGNTANVTDRTFNPCKTRWVRIYITKGLQNNVNFASIGELEVYDTNTTDATLSALGIYHDKTKIDIEPAFDKNIGTYKASVSYDVDEITVMPTSTDPKAVITVNGDRVYSGESSKPISLTEGSTTPVKVLVTPVIGDARTYTVDVGKARSPYLKNLVLRQGMSFLTLKPVFNRKTLEYELKLPGVKTIEVTATTESDKAKLKINSHDVTSGVEFQILVSQKEKPILIEVTIPEENDYSKKYQIHVI